MNSGLLSLSYLIGSVSFIIGLKMLSHPDTARKGNLYAAIGMTLAIFATIFLYTKDGVGLGNHLWIFGALIIGSVVGTMAAKKVQMTNQRDTNIQYGSVVALNLLRKMMNGDYEN